MGDESDQVVGADRVLAVLTELAAHPSGITLTRWRTALATSGSPVHRALPALRRPDLAELTSRGVYVLGDEFLWLAFRDHAGPPEGLRIEPVLQELAGRYDETVH